MGKGKTFFRACLLIYVERMYGSCIGIKELFPMKTKERSMVTGALILSGAALFVRMAGFVFRIYLSNAMGAEGMGVHMLIMSLYNVCVTLATSGVATAVSTLCAQQLALGREDNARQVLRRAFLLALLISTAVGAAVFLFARPIGVVILKEARTVASLRVLAMGLPFLSLSACVRGYFVASRRVGNPAAAQILEQLVKMTFIMALLGYWLPQGIEYGCLVVVGGMTVGEIVCFVFSYCGYRQGKRRAAKPNRAVNALTGVTGKILAVIVPLSLSAYVRSFLRLAEDVLILYCLKIFSGQDAVATGLYGMLKGMVMPLLIFPLMLLSAFVCTLTPEISRLHTAGSTKKMEQTIGVILRYTFIVGILVVAVFMTFPQEIGTAVYKNEQVGELLRRLAFLCPFMCVEMVVVGILNGMGAQITSMKYAIADSLLRIGLVYWLIPGRGIDGFTVMVVASNLFTSVLNFMHLMKLAQITIRFNEWMIKPALAAAAASQILRAVWHWLPASTPENLWRSLVPGLGCIVVLYGAVLFAIGSVQAGDFRWIAGQIKSAGKVPRSAPEKLV